MTNGEKIHMVFLHFGQIVVVDGTGVSALLSDNVF